MLRQGRQTAWVVLAVLAGAMPLAAQSVTRHGSWSSHTDRGDGNQPCFVAAGPMVREPKGPRRDPAFAYVTLLPKEGIAGEVSFKLGFPLRHGSQTIVTIGAAQFRLFVLGERAFVASRDEEARLLASMRKGTRMVVTAIADRGGAVTRDTYSLTGLAPALQAAEASACSGQASGR